MAGKVHTSAHLQRRWATYKQIIRGKKKQNKTPRKTQKPKKVD